jgi:hypothetical protein
MAQFKITVYDASGIAKSAIATLPTTALTGTLQAAQFPALTGDITTSAGSLATTLRTSPTIVTPTIASFTNAAHDHTNAAGGGTLSGSAIASGTVAAARLDTMTGDSGSGGASGAAPAPASGDAALNKVLLASGVFGLPIFNKLKARTVIGSDVASYTISSFSANYDHLALVLETRTDRAANTDSLICRFNADGTAGNYYTQYRTASGTTLAAAEVLGSGTTGILLPFGGVGNSGSAGNGYFVLIILNYNSASMARVCKGEGFAHGANTSGNLNEGSCGGSWRNTSNAITSITVLPNLGTNIKTNSAYTLYGF